MYVTLSRHVSSDVQSGPDNRSYAPSRFVSTVSLSLHMFTCLSLHCSPRAALVDWLAYGCVAAMEYKQ
jgi:hypothetical protein